MKIFLDDIKSIEWLSSSIIQTNWGKNFLNLPKGFNFVFNYNLLEEESSIDVKSSKQVINLNDYIYKNMDAAHVGYMREPFDSNNYLFFSLLRSACRNQEEVDKLIDIFVQYKAVDLAESKKNLKTYIIGSIPVNSRISFSNAINEYFVEKSPTHGICMVYDLIDGLAMKKVKKSIYGQLLTKIVRAIKNPNGGLLQEVAGSRMRYMIVGEVAAGDDVELQKAKDLYRGGNSIYDTYLQTGWYLNKFDGKWRKKVSDDSFSFKMDKISQKNGEYFVIDKAVPKNEVIAESLCEGKITLTELVGREGFQTKLGDYISYQDIFKIYPKLEEIYSFLSAGVLSDRDYAFYFNPSEPNSLVLIYGKKYPMTIEDLKYVALHEMQHYVQRVEDFGSGGNLELANIVNVAGGESTKLFFSSLSAFQNRFSDVCTLISVEDYQELCNQLLSDYKELVATGYKEKRRINPSRNNPTMFVEITKIYASMLQDLVYKTRRVDSIQGNSNSISYYLLAIYSMIEEENKHISDFVNKHIGKDYLELFKMSLRQTRDLIEKENAFNIKGWTAQDLYILNFQLYESLIGEIEARFTQQTTKIPIQLKDYFDLYTSETINTDRVAVINNSIVADDGKKYVAALETTADEKYILHLPDEFSNSVNILHETGHVLFDLIKDEVYLKSFKNDLILDEEYFCSCFVDYVHRKNIDPMLTMDLDREREKLGTTEFDEIFENALYNQKTELDERGMILRLDFIMKILQ